MLVYKSEQLMKVKDAPVGLFLLEDSNELICISEYRSNGSRDAIIVSSGENYCGKGDDGEGYSIIVG